MGMRWLARGESREITRRRLLAGAAAAGVASLARPARGLAATALQRQSVFSAGVGTLVGTSSPIRPGRTFALAGIEWNRSAKAAVELRAQAPDGRWSPWVSASVLGHDGDGRTTTDIFYGEPVWTGPAVALQLRSARPVSGVRVQFVSVRVPGTAGAAAALPLATPVLDAGPGQPPIIARKAWAAGAAHPVHTPQYGSVKLGFVHHTVNPNGYSAAAVPAMLRGIFDYHVHVRGWWDIGYNFVIDAYGRIWEARAGGIDMAVVGAQAGGYNTESMGVSILGDFMSVTPSFAAQRALEHLLAWKLSLHGIPSTGRVTVVVDPADAYYTPFRPGAHVSLPRVAGHRDGDLTDCPGNALYDRLPAIRPRVSALAGTPARLTITAAPALITPGTSVELSGALRLLSGEPLAGAPVELQVMRPTGPPASPLANLTSAADGTWSQTLSFNDTTLVRAVHDDPPASVSDWFQISVEPAITLTVQTTSPLVLSGTVAPAKSHVILELYRGATPRGKPIRQKLVASGSGSFTGQLRAPGPGDYVAVARTVGDAENVAGASAPVGVTIS